MMVQWQEILVIASTINFNDDEDQPIWQYETNGVYSSSSMYNVINFRGIQPIYCLLFGNLRSHLGLSHFYGSSLKIK
jgi:hypothetical protein